MCLCVYEIVLLPIGLYWPSSVVVFLCLCNCVVMKLCYYQLGCIGPVLRKQTASLRRYNSTSLHLRLVWNAKMKLHISAKQDETILHFCWYRLVQLLFLWQTQVWSLHSLNCPSITPFFVSLIRKLLSNYICELEEGGTFNLDIGSFSSKLWRKDF